MKLVSWLALWLTCWLAFLMIGKEIPACFLDLLAAWLVGWLVVWLMALLVGLLARWTFADWRAGKLVTDWLTGWLDAG